MGKWRPLVLYCLRRGKILLVAALFAALGAPLAQAEGTTLGDLLGEEPPRPVATSKGIDLDEPVSRPSWESLVSSLASSQAQIAQYALDCAQAARTRYKVLVEAHREALAAAAFRLASNQAAATDTVSNLSCPPVSDDVILPIDQIGEARRNLWALARETISGATMPPPGEASGGPRIATSKMAFGVPTTRAIDVVEVMAQPTLNSALTEGYCSGILISQQYVLTAAHCARANKAVYVRVAEDTGYGEGNALIETDSTETKCRTSPDSGCPT